MGKLDDIQRREEQAKEREAALAKRAKLPRRLCQYCKQEVIIREAGGLETHATAPFLRDICTGSSVLHMPAPAATRPPVTKPETPKSKRRKR